MRLFLLVVKEKTGEPYPYLIEGKYTSQLDWVYV